MNLVHKIIDFDLEQVVSETWKRYWVDIKVFLLVFVLNVFIYGQKIFFHSLANDDRTRFRGRMEDLLQGHWNGRWFNDVMHSLFFKDIFHILPYFNFLIALFSLTLAGFFTAKVYFKEQNNIRIVLITIICAVTPFATENFIYNTNMVAWIFTPIGIYGVWLLKKPTWSMRILGMVLFSLAIGTYQAMFQIGIILVFFDAILKLMNTNDRKEVETITRSFIFAMTMVVVGFLLYVSSNYLYVKLTLSEEVIIGSYLVGEMSVAERITEFFWGIIRAYRFSPLYSFFERLFNYLIYIAFFLPLLFLYSVIKKSQTGNQFQHGVLWFRFGAIVFLVALLPLVIGLPKLTNFSIPVRSYYPVSWALVGLYLMSLKSSNWVRNLFQINILVFLIFSIMYINVYFYSASRQLIRDEIITNDIVSQIRLHPNYTDEKNPLPFRVEGFFYYRDIAPFLVSGFRPFAHNGLNCYWCTYQIFGNLSSFNFTSMNDTDYTPLEEYIINETIAEAQSNNTSPEIIAYPSKNSIWVKDGQVVLFLDSEEINKKIQERLE